MLIQFCFKLFRMFRNNSFIFKARREEKTRDRKQRLMMETDPEKQRRLEKLEQKREAKQKQPKMKQFKIK